MKKSILVTVTHTGDTVAGLEAKLSRWVYESDYNAELYFSNINPTYSNRNTCVKYLLEKTEHTHLLFIDSDTVPFDNPLKMIEHNKDIIGGVYPMWRVDHFEWLAMKRKPDGLYKTISPDKRKGLVEVDGLGAGCLMISRRVLENMQAPFKDKIRKDGRREIGHDYYFCLPPNQYICGDDLKYIQNIKKGEYLASAKYDSSRTKVLDSFEREYNGKIIEIKPFYYEQISLTPKHKVLVKRWISSGETQIIKRGLGNTKNIKLRQGHIQKMWIEAEKVKKGDLVKIVKSTRQGNPKKQISIKNYLAKKIYTIKGEYIYLNRDSITDNLGEKSISKKLPKTIVIDDVFIKFLGYYIAEGCVSIKSGYNIDISSNDKDRLKEYVEPFVKKLGINYQYRKLKDNWHLYFYSKLFGKFLINLVGDKSNRKHFPEFWTQLTNENLSLLIKSYWLGDGCSFKHKKEKYKNYSSIFTCSSNSKKLIKQIKFALTRFDILGAIYIKKFDNKNWKDIYELKIISYFNPKFAELIGVKFKNTKKVKLNFQIRGKQIWVKVKEIKKRDYKGRVYNLETRNNTYNCNGIVIHNCERAKEKGYKIYADWDILCDHIKQIPLMTMVKALKRTYDEGYKRGLTKANNKD